MNDPNQHEQPASRPVHGGIRPAQLRSLGLEPADVLDFSASVSPLGPPRGLWEAMQRVDLTAYPDPECLELKEALAQIHGAATGSILVGNGSTELIHLLARAYLNRPSDGAAPTVLLFTPTYGEYAGACALEGAAIREVVACREVGFAWDLERAADLIATQKPVLVFLCNPNNPTGVYLGMKEVTALAHVASQSGALLVLDEAYVNFVEDRWDAPALLREDAGESVVVLRSMTKDYALTGLRLGYALGTTEVIDRLARLQPDWSVNGLAQVSGLVALSDADYLPAARRAVREARDFLVGSLRQIGFRPLPTSANYLLVEVGDGAVWRERLMLRGIFVRDCASFGLPDCIRIGIRALPDCERLVEAMSLEMKR
jgi:histidinol-phosphate aminotransferase